MNPCTPRRLDAHRLRLIILLLAAAGCALLTAHAQGRFGSTFDERKLRTAREAIPRSVVLPAWDNPIGFEKDVFTFARIIFGSNAGRFANDGWGGGGRGQRWALDFPDADLNFSHRLQQMTSAKVDPDARVLRLTDPELTDYPFIFILHIENIVFSPEEGRALRSYLLNGGAMLVNDFWGEEAWRNFESEMRRVFPELHWTELDFDHPIFRIVFPIKPPMSSLRVPTIHMWNRDYVPGNPASNPSSNFRGAGSDTMHIRALHDEKGRIISIAIHNSDISDGWEREGENAEYFKIFSEPRAYPLGINIITYFMTH